MNSQPIEEKASSITGNVKLNLKNLSELLRMANELQGFFIDINWYGERSLIFKIKIANAAAMYHSDNCQVGENYKIFQTMA